MCRERHNPVRQRGVSLVAMMAIIVLLALVAAGMVRLVATSQVAVGNEVLSLRAFLAAESAAQNAMNRLFPLNGGAATCGTINLAFTAGGLAGCSALAACSGPVSIQGQDIYRITSTGTCGSGEAVARRTIRVGARAP